MRKVAKELLRLARLLIEVEGDNRDQVADAYAELNEHYGDRVETSGMGEEPDEQGDFEAGMVLSARRKRKATNGLNGMSKQQALRFLNTLIAPFTKGMFHDESWQPVHKIFDALNKADVPFVVTSAEYQTSKFIQEQSQIRDTAGWRAPPDSKVWHLEVEFENNKGRPTKVYGVITASGAGTVSDPLSRYDLVAYFS